MGYSLCDGQEIATPYQYWKARYGRLAGSAKNSPQRQRDVIGSNKYMHPIECGMLNAAHRNGTVQADK